MKSFRNILGWYFSKKSLPYWLVLMMDSVIIVASAIVVYWLFHGGYATLDSFPGLMRSLGIYLIISIVSFRIFHTYSGIVRYSSFVDLERVGYANMLALAIGIAIHYPMYQAPDGLLTPMSTRELIGTYAVATVLMWGMRILVKSLYDLSASDGRAMRALIYGVQDGGVGLAKNIRTQRPARFQLCGFIAHEQGYGHHSLMGVKVYETLDEVRGALGRRDIEAVLISPLRNGDFRNEQELQDLLIKAGVKIYMSAGEMEWDGKTDVSRLALREVSVEDLLPREEISVDMAAVGKQLKGRRVMVTGSAGSIGSELVRQIAALRPSALLLVDQAETPQHDIRLMMAREWPYIECRTVVADISNMVRMEDLIGSFRPDYVFHAAAYKHVPMMEDDPGEAVMNNVLGTKVVADLSVRYGVRKFVMVSTDKAVNPTNVMGCSKRICEIYVQALDRMLKIEQLKQKPSSSSKKQHYYTQFVTTRFGNVLGSNGSVIPLFREQIRNGGPVTVTDERIVRYFMLIPEACKLVLEAGTKGNGGEIFVFDMGRPVKIADLAARMIKLSGAKNVEIKYTGLRDGEKLYEEMLNDKEKTKPTFHEKIRIAKVREYDYEQVAKDIDELIEISKQYDDIATVRKMKEIVPEYKSENSPKYEKLDKEKQ